MSITSANFEKLSRMTKVKADIYFDAQPLSVTRDNYMIDISILEEASAVAASKPLGEPSVNEMVLTLLNSNNMFNPENNSSAYYGKIGRNLMIVVSYTEGEFSEDWLPFGTFYVTNWKVPTGGVAVTVIARDRIQNYIKQPMKYMELRRNETYKSFIERGFAAMGIPEVYVDEALTGIVNYAYGTNETFGAWLKKVTEASLAFCFVDRLNRIQVVAATKSAVSVGDISESTILLSATLDQDIVKTYTDLKVTYHMPFVGNEDSFLTENDLVITDGINELDYVNGSLIMDVTNVSITGHDKLDIDSLSYTPWTVSLVAIATGSGVGTLDIRGRVVETNTAALTYELEATDEIPNVMDINNEFIQSAEVAALVGSVMSRLLVCKSLLIELSTRGNPLLQLNDIVTIVNPKHSIESDAKIIRADYMYNGALSCKYTVMNADALEVL